MLNYSDTWEEFVDTVTKKYEELASIQYAHIRALDNVWASRGFFNPGRFGIGFTGDNGKDVHAPTLAVALALTCDEHFLSDLLWAWTEITDDDGFVVTFPSIEVDKFNDDCDVVHFSYEMYEKELEVSEERIHQMTRVSAGDYLCLDNAERHVWRFTRWEDGPDLGAERTATYWKVSRFPLAEIQRHIVSRTNYWDGVDWEVVDYHQPTRSDAIRTMMRVTERENT